jgi:hypothetical protein
MSTGRRDDGRVTLTNEQKQFCKISGCSEADYRQGPYRTSEA